MSIAAAVALTIPLFSSPYIQYTPFGEVLSRMRGASATKHEWMKLWPVPYTGQVI